MFDPVPELQHNAKTHRVVNTDSYYPATYVLPEPARHSQNFVFDTHSPSPIVDSYRSYPTPGTYPYLPTVPRRNSTTGTTPAAGPSSIYYQWTPLNVSVPIEPLGSPRYSHPRRDSLPAVASPSSPPEEMSMDASSSSSHLLRVESETILSTHDEARSPPPRLKNTRKKVHIELATNQPKTTLGNPRERVFIACRQCRERKIRCSGETPSCHYCKNRPHKANQCQYDQEPKRRGPDKNPGTRQRMAGSLKNELCDKATPGRRRINRKGERTTSRRHSNRPISQKRSITPDTVASVGTPTSAPPLDETASLFEEVLSDWQNSGSSRGSSRTVSLYTDPYHFGQGVDAEVLPISRLGQSTMQGRSAEDTTRGVDVVSTAVIGDYHWRENGSLIPAQPSLNFNRKTWWDSLLSLYSMPFSHHMAALTPSRRAEAIRCIKADLGFIFSISNYWFAFFHIPSFFRTYHDPTRRERMQPSLLLSLLAISTFWQSSEIGRGKDGRERAMRFRDEAQCALDASFNGNAVDESLAQAAWILALFEICAHPDHSTARSTDAMKQLDRIVRYLDLTKIDADDPRASSFSPLGVPSVSSGPQPLEHRAPYTGQRPLGYDLSTRFSALPDTSIEGPIGCSCSIATLGSRWPQAHQFTPCWVATPAWDPDWSEAEIRRESCRRLCWSAVTLAAGHLSYSSLSNTGPMDLLLGNTTNYSLLFSGESVAESQTLGFTFSPKDSIWALHDRAFMLWHACMQKRQDPLATDDDKSRFGLHAWLAAESLENALNRHTCNIERAFIYHGREYLLNTRMTVSCEFQRYIPYVTPNPFRQKAREWLNRQLGVAQMVMSGVSTVTGNSTNTLAGRPFFVFWFMSQVSRALSLWACDKSMTLALDVCKAFLAPIEYLSALWPCTEQRSRYLRLRERVEVECRIAGLTPIPAPNFALPSHVI